MRFRSIRFKIIASVVAYIAVIGVLGNLWLYTHLNRIVTQKAEHLDRLYTDAVRGQLERGFSEVFNLSVICAHDTVVARIVSREDHHSLEAVRESLHAQDLLNSYLRSCPVNGYVDKLILFNEGDLLIQAYGRQNGEVTDREKIAALPLFAELLSSGEPWIVGFGGSITASKLSDSFMILFRVDNIYDPGSCGYLYLEMGLDMVSDEILRYADPGSMFVVLPETGAVLSSRGRLTVPDGDEYRWTAYDDGQRIRRGNRTYRLDRTPLESVPLGLYSLTDVTSLAREDMQILYSVLIVVLASLLAAGGIAVTLSMHLTRPIQVLISRIKKISANDFSYDPGIEKSHDEIGSIGRVVNEMSQNISRLLRETEEMYEQRKNAEIALLQTQVNPHFLYNTLNSIQWMAEIQKNPGIADMTRSLTNLLRNIAGITGDKITLEEELRLLDDYGAIQSVRFMGIFEMVNTIPREFLSCRIVKLTLQPLVENAIIHGIEPSGSFGTIVLSAREEGPYLCITVEDSGQGMTPEEIAGILSGEHRESGTSFNRIGVANVHTRLQLVYGGDCGLSFESEKGSFTRVTVRIRKEQ
ncbi:sensor histidine kinase [Breznakiella homolactica]|uniref:Sensor histidine kinase n=1 Tax=Breznakiella homolactica TaxID=2798577 RepID=A0A7T7XQW2_9SPIR|nr:sensor histidine kinase [Breznakiella homolactica]QQO10845.1 sensor histidine kinase [Breznakiella homolactica]